MSQFEDLYLSFDSRGGQRDDGALTSEYLSELASGAGSAFRRGVNDVAQAALRLIEGDKRLEIVGAGKDKPKQDWLVVMNLATDFGNECTIEKRTKKLQELAADTKGKNVTILVQSAVKDGEGKYKIERFALSDGKIQKLESPGKSEGYATDVEKLLKFANKEYNPTNLALVLDSHGTGNGGLSGDTGDVSMSQLKNSIKEGLKGSGRDKLDVLQFNACLMGQNGVLETTQGLAKHVVASAEPEGTGAQGRDFDNKVLSALLKKPTMTADELADTAVKQAKDNAEDFPTLAHFDMEHYKKFRESLDSFGEKLAKLCEDPKQLEVIRGLIKDTFSYGGGGLNLFNFFQGMWPKPSSGGDSGGWLNQLFKEEAIKPSEGGAMGAFLGRRCESNKRDLKDFVAHVLLAISKGQLKDEDGSLTNAAKAVLINGTRLTKSLAAAGDKRKEIGGLSAFLPCAPTEYRGDDPVVSTTGGWRIFQNTLLKKAGEKKK